MTSKEKREFWARAIYQRLTHLGVAHVRVHGYGLACPMSIELGSESRAVEFLNIYGSEFVQGGLNFGYAYYPAASIEGNLADLFRFTIKTVQRYQCT